MQPKHENARRQPTKHNKPSVIAPKLVEVAHLSLHEIDLITGNEENLYTLFYEVYRGYTIYSTEQGNCCIHGKDGCLRIGGQYVCFPDVEQAKNLIKHFQADGRTSQEGMDRYVPEDAYSCLNRQPRRQGRTMYARTVSA